MNVVRKLNALGKEVNATIPCINNGGCCVYAALVVSALRKHKIKATGFVASDYAVYSQDITDYRKHIFSNSVEYWNNNV